MTDSQWRYLDVLDVKRRKLEEMLSVKRTALAKVSVSASVLARFKPPTPPVTNRNDASATSPHKRPATTRGGRKRLATEKQRFYLIGRTVNQKLDQFEAAFRLLKELKTINGNWDLDALRRELAKRHFDPKEIHALLHARTPMSAAKRFVAQSLSRSLQTINSCYSRYLKVLKSQRPPV
jgi:hypothetical protein